MPLRTISSPRFGRSSCWRPSLGHRAGVVGSHKDRHIATPANQGPGHPTRRSHHRLRRSRRSCSRATFPSSCFSCLFVFCSCTPPLAFADHFGQVLSRANLEGACLHTWVLRHQLDGVIQVPGFEHEDSAQLLFRLGIRAIGEGHLAVLPPQGGGVPSALERFPTHKVTALSKHVVVGEALVHHGVPLAFGHRLPLLLVVVSKAYVFHNFLLICGVTRLCTFRSGRAAALLARGV